MFEVGDRVEFKDFVYFRGNKGMITDINWSGHITVRLDPGYSTQALESHLILLDKDSLSKDYVRSVLLETGSHLALSKLGLVDMPTEPGTLIETSDGDVFYKTKSGWRNKNDELLPDIQIKKYYVKTLEF